MACKELCDKRAMVTSLKHSFQTTSQQILSVLEFCEASLADKMKNFNEKLKVDTENQRLSQKLSLLERSCQKVSNSKEQMQQNLATLEQEKLAALSEVEALNVQLMQFKSNIEALQLENSSLRLQVEMYTAERSSHETDNLLETSTDCHDDNWRDIKSELLQLEEEDVFATQQCSFQSKAEFASGLLVESSSDTFEMTVEDQTQTNDAMQESPFVLESSSTHHTTAERFSPRAPLWSAIKSHFCTLCSATFSSKKAVQEHMRRHTGEKPFACHICNVSFRHSASLRNHMRTHSDKAVFSCGVCGMTTKWKASARHHEEMHRRRNEFAATDLMHMSSTVANQPKDTSD